jgi:thymidylate synthase
MIEQCKKCARARNQVNGLYCYSLWRYVEHDKGTRVPCSVLREWKMADGSVQQGWANDFVAIEKLNKNAD